MAFGIKRQELEQWKERAASGELAFLTHFWHDGRFPEYQTVTKVACSDVEKLVRWGRKHGLKREWIHHRSDFPHFDLLGEKQQVILAAENKSDQLARLVKRIKRKDE
nr:hypothetical protein [Evansella caseinilytica]